MATVGNACNSGICRHTNRGQDNNRRHNRGKDCLKCCLTSWTNWPAVQAFEAGDLGPPARAHPRLHSIPQGGQTCWNPPARHDNEKIDLCMRQQTYKGKHLSHHRHHSDRASFQIAHAEYIMDKEYLKPILVNMDAYEN